MKKIRILIADDHKMVREGLIECLKHLNKYEIFEATSGAEAIEKVMKLTPDVILMDIGMPNINGLEATKAIIKHDPAAKILVLTAHYEKEYVVEIMKAGAKGYMLKDTSSDELAKAIDLISLGNIYFSAGLSNTILSVFSQFSQKTENRSKNDLTDREIDVLKLIAQGCINKEIANKLGLSIKTIIAHRIHIINKLNIHTAAGLAKYAIEKGIIKNDIN
jgi:DNA-binding NarL/FixJ family response regulator